MLDAHVITRGKRTNTYREIVDSLGLDPDRAWMIGNSTRSDICPALEAGIHAVLIPHAMTWHLEHIELEQDSSWAGKFVKVQRFRDLGSLFRNTAGP